MAVPQFYELMNPLLQTLHQLGDSASIPEMEETVARIMGLAEEDVNQIHRGSRTKLGYRLAWARTYLKKYGLLDNSERGVWSLTNEGKQTTSVDTDEVLRIVRAGNPEVEVDMPFDEQINDLDVTPSSVRWNEELLEVLRTIHPDAFQTLCMRLLRESGFVQAEVTGRSGDGGIDGKGILKIGGLISFRVLFQCKRYRETVTPSEIRDFQGAIIKMYPIDRTAMDFQNPFIRTW